MHICLGLSALCTIFFAELSRMIHGAKNEQNMKVVFYDEAEAFTVLDQFLHAYKTS